jgi:hypothetical protein
MSVDDVVAAWAATVRLSDATAQDIYEQIMRTHISERRSVPGLDPHWWRHFTSEFAAQVVTSTRPAAWAGRGR